MRVFNKYLFTKYAKCLNLILVRIWFFFQVLSTCLYLSVLALVDLVVLYTRCGNEWLLHLANLDISQKLMVYSESICKVYPFVFNFLFHLSRWLIVAAALEGFISVKYPERLESLCNLDRARAVILLLTVLLVCVNMHFFWSYELVPVDDLQIPQLFCTFAKYGHQHSEEFQNIIWPMFDIIISDVLPYIIVIVCSVVMTIQICRGRHMGQRAFRDWQEKYTLDSAAINQSKITILIAAYFFIFLTLPKFGYGIFKYLMDSHGILEYSFELDAKITLADAVVTMLEYFCLSCKFFVYAASSRRFRFEVITLFQCVPACRRLKFRLQKSNSSTRPLMTDCSATLNSNCSEQMPQSQTLDFQTSIITSL